MHSQRGARKITQPNVSVTTLHRASLVQMLHKITAEPAERKQPMPYALILLSAPAGYGKTTLLVDFAQQTTLPCCWYFLDSADSDPLTFMGLLIESLRQRFPYFGDHLRVQHAALTTNEVNQAGQLHQFESLMDAITQEIETEITESFVLCLCNYHEINACESINSLVNRFLHQLPSQITLIIESRAIPALELTSLVARRRLFGIGSSHLRFTTSDIQQLTQLQGEPWITEAEIDLLVSSFDGWIAGILLGTRLGGLPNFDTPQHDGTNLHIDRQYLFAYMMNEVFKREPEVYTFLREVSLLEQMFPAFCNNLLHITDAGDRLAYIEKQGLFVSRSSDGEQFIYSCHPILRELLYVELCLQDSKHAFDLHLRAAKLFYACQEYDQAISHAVLAQEYDFALTIIEENADNMLQQGYVETVLRWIEALPVSYNQRSPRLLLSRAIIHTMRHEVIQAVELLKMAQEYVEHDLTMSGRDLMLAEIFVTQARVLFEAGKYRPAQEKCYQTLALLPIDERKLRARTLQRLGMCASLLGDLHVGITQMQQALQLWGHNTEILQTALLHGNLANAYNMIGNYVLSEHHRARAIISCERLGDKHGKINNMIGMAITRRNKGELDEAEAVFNEVLSMAREEQFIRGQAYVLENLGELYVDKDDFSNALLMTEDALALARQLNDIYLVNSSICTLSLAYLFMDDPSTATVLVDQVEVSEEDTTSYISALRELTKGTIYLRQQHYAEAVNSLNRAEVSCEQASLKRLHLRALIRLGAAYLCLLQFAKAMCVLEKAAKLSRQKHYEHIAEIEIQRFPLLREDMSKPFTSISFVEEESISPTQSMDTPKSEHAAEKPLVSPCTKTTLRVWAFGEPEVHINDVPVTHWRMARSMELYFFLLDQQGLVRKDLIIERLWPDADDHIDQTLRSTIYYLRKALGESCIVYRGGAYSLDLTAQYKDQIWYDVALFDQRYTKAKQALAEEDDSMARTYFWNWSISIVAIMSSHFIAIGVYSDVMNCADTISIVVKS